MLNHIQMQQARTQSQSIAASAGIEIPDHLPLIEAFKPRGLEAVVDRALCLHVILAVAYGFSREKAIAWLTREDLLGALTPDETGFLYVGKGAITRFRGEVEALWALAWALGLAEEMDFWSSCADDLNDRMQNLHAAEASDRIRTTARLRPAEEILQALDLAFCLHWALRQAQLKGRRRPSGLDPLRIEERRHALEWLAGGSDWDAPTMDT